jgi:hypothetical protein
MKISVSARATLHDLRESCATGASGLGTNRTRIIVLLSVGTVVASYLVFPSWKMLRLPWSLTLALGFSYFFVLTLLLSVPLKKAATQPHKDEKWSFRQLWSPAGAGLIVLTAAFTLAQSYYLDLPILSGPDEPVLVATNLRQWQALSNGYRWFEYVLLSVVIGGAIAYTVLCSIRITTLRRSMLGTLIGLALAAICLFALLYASRYVTLQLPEAWGDARRWPPVGTLLGVASYGLLGENEIASRIPSVLFYAGTGIVVFRFAAAVSDRRSALVAAAICYATPVLFEYGHLDFRDVGGAFFLLLGTFYVARYLDTADPDDLKLSAVIAAIAFLERQPAAAVIFVLFLSVFTMRILIPAVRRRAFSFRVEAWNLVLAGAVFVWMVLPWHLISASVRPYKPYPENLLTPKLLFAYAELMPRVYGWPLVILALAGTMMIVVRRSTAGVVALFGLMFVYVLFTADDPYWIPEPRFTVLMAPFMAVIAAFALSVSLFRIESRKIWIASWMIIGLLPLWAWHPGENYFPFDQLVKDLKGGLIPPGRLLYPHYWQTSFDVYRAFYQVQGYELIKPEWRPSGERHTTVSGLTELCQQHGCDALVLAGARSSTGVSVFGVDDLDFVSISMDKIDGFHVLKTFWFRTTFLTVAKPLQDDVSRSSRRPSNPR